MKKIIFVILVTINIQAWEINTHRAIERKAIEKSENLKMFVKNSGITTNSYIYNNEKFEGYDATYLRYITDKNVGEKNGISKWAQTFGTKPSYQKMIEAGSILEDAIYPDALLAVNGRFNNHFYDAQNGGHALTFGYGLRVNALKWGTVGAHDALGTRENQYTYLNTLNYFSKAFTQSSPTQSRKYQAKMLVGVGHLLHLMNDMTSTAHTRDDSHPFGDPLEKWGRGGEEGDQPIGFRIKGDGLKDYLGIVKYNGSINLPNIPKYKTFSDFITKEATWTATHFFSGSTIFTKPKPAPSDTYESYDYSGSGNGIDKYYIVSDGYHGIPKTKLGIHIKTYIINALKEKFYTGSSNHIVIDKATSFRGDYSVLKENAKLLIPRAIANARNFLNYFFRGQISATITDNAITVKNVSSTSLVASGAVILRPNEFYNGGDDSHGRFRFFYEEDDGTRHPFYFRYDWDKIDQSNEIAFIGSVDALVNWFLPRNRVIAPGESFTVPIILDYDTKVLLRHKKVIAIYDGTIGHERGITVCSAQRPSGGIVIRE